MFILKTTAMYQALKLKGFFQLVRILKILFLGLWIILFVLSLFAVFTGFFPGAILEKFLGAAIFTLGPALFFLELSLFFEGKLKKPKPFCRLAEAIVQPADFNFASFLELEAAQACQTTLKEARKKKLREPSKELLLYCLFGGKFREIDFIVGRAGLHTAQIQKALKQEFLKTGTEWQPHFEATIFQAAKIAQKRNKEKINVADMLIALADSSSYFQKLLILEDLKKEDIENLADWYERAERNFKERRKFWKYENLLTKGSIGRDWASGYSITLDRYAGDLRKKLEKSGFREIVGHEREIKQVERILEKTEINNVLLIGEEGTGRKSIVAAVVQRAYTGKSSPSVNYKRFLDFDIGRLSSELTSGEQVEAALDQCFRETVEAGNIVLVIEEIHKFLCETPRLGALDISEVLSRYLPFPSFQLIAICSYKGFHQIVEKNPFLANLFEKVEAAEVSEKETLELLENFLPFFERKHKKFVSYKALREILRLSGRYVQDLPWPEKAVRLLDEAMSWLATFTKEQVLEPNHIKKLISEKIEIPLEEMEAREKGVLLNLEKIIHERIINQEEAVSEISNALRRARAEIGARARPVGSFLFLGPTGVGKTETAKALAASYFGRENRMIRLDMSEFQEIKAITALVGKTGQEGLLTTPIRENPFSLLLLDEIEKAHYNVLNLFLQILDEGWVTAGDGRRVSFANTLIIATSNAGAELIRERVKENRELKELREELLEHLFRERVFRPEFINRFDGIIVFKPLNKAELLLIAHLMLKKLADGLKDKGVDFEITGLLKQAIAELGYSPEFGAREMRRVIQDKVENLLARAIISGRLKRGNKARIKVEDNKFDLIVE